jgi:hypothetical protein
MNRHADKQPSAIYVSLDDLAETMGISLESLKAKIDAGKIAVMEAKHGKPPKRTDKKYKPFENVTTTPLDAAAEFGVSQVTVNRWIKAGYLSVIEPGRPHHGAKIKKADVMYLIDLQDYRERVNGSARGYPLFDKNGEPILTIRHPMLADYRRRRRIASTT